MTQPRSNDPMVHRDLVVQTDPMQGRDVANLQRALRKRLSARGLGDDVPVPTHGKFTHATWLACVEAGYFLGLRADTYLRTKAPPGTGGARPGGALTGGVCTRGAQLVIREPESRDETQLKRAEERKAQLARGPRYYAGLLAPPTATRGPEAALAFARKHIGLTESPAGSNWGPTISTWIKAAGYNGPIPWCGAACNAFVMAAGVPSGAGWIGYTPAIIQHARTGAGGWRWVGTAEGRSGDLALFDTPGGDPAVHVGMVEKRLSPSSYQTIEGNTSSGDGGSQANGGGVFRRVRSTGGSFYIVGFARPPY